MRINIEIEDELLQRSSAIFKRLGLTTEQAISVFLTKSIAARGLPFSLILEETETPNQSDIVPEISNAEITRSIITLVEQHLPNDEIMRLLQADYCREQFAISFPVLKPVKSNDAAEIKAAAKDANGHNRYSTKKIAQHNNSQYYLVCTQWTNRHRAAFIHWREQFI